MAAPLLVTQEASHDAKVLIVDKRGIIGDILARSLLGDFSVILVTARPLHSAVPYLHIPFKSKTPRIPDEIFSHIFLLFEGETELISLLPEFSQKAMRSGSPLVLVTSIYTITKEKIATIKKHAPEALLFLYGDVGGAELSSQINHLLLESLIYGSIRLRENGLTLLYPSPLPQMLTGLMGTVFGKKQKGETYFLFHQHPMTTLSFAREIKKQFPDIKLDFTTEKGEKVTSVLPVAGTYVSLPPTSEWIKTLSFPKHMPSQKNVHKKVALSLAPRPKRGIKTTLLVLVLLIILPFSLGISSALAGGLFLKTGVTQLSQASFAKGESNLQIAKQFFRISETVAVPFTMLETIGVGAPARVFRSTLGAGEDISTAGLLFVQAGTAFEAINTGKSAKPETDIAIVTDRIKRGITILQRLKAEEELPSFITTHLATYDSSLRLLAATVDTLPPLLGFPRQTTYLVLFQNNRELRGGGGFIGSYGLIRFEKGKMISFTLHDVYDADGQLKGHVEPPFALRRYLGAAHWYLRDSNYAADFPTNADKAGFFLQKETGEKVDGVLSLDATVLEQILGVTGPLPLPDYNQTLTADNAFSLLETKTQEKFFPGSSQKKSVLRAAYTALEQKLLSDKKLSGKLLPVLSQQLAEKHMLIASYDPAIQKVFATNKLSSAIPSVIGDPSLIEDFMGVNEMNLGQNKANEYVTRTLDHSVKIDEKGVLLAGTSVTLKNESTASSLYGGAYDAYIRFITPLQSQFVSVSFDDVEQTSQPAETNPVIYTRKQFQQPKAVEVEKSEEKGRTLYGIHVLIPAGTQKKITVMYALPGEQNDGAFTYHLELFKQPGTLADPVSVSVNFPNTFMLVRTSPKFVKAETTATYQQPFTEDTVLTGEFARKR